MPIRLATALVFAILSLGACSPGSTPLYRDYSAPPVTPEELQQRILTALDEAGWKIDSVRTDGVVTTQRRTVSRFLLYHVDVRLDVLPLDGRYVRVLLFPYRYFITGNRSMIAFMRPGIERSVLPSLSSAFRRQGLVLVGTPIDRDRKRTRSAIR